MQIRCGPIPEDFTPDESWHALREPGPLMVQLLALPVGLCLAFPTAYLWHLTGIPATLYFGTVNRLLLPVLLVLSFPVLIVVHELLHAVANPRFGLSPATVLGLWPKGLVFYNHYSGALSRNRFLLIFAMPLLVITVLPLVVSAVLILPPTVASWAAWFSIWNALFACGDCVGMALLLFQIPRKAWVRNSGWKTYWQPLA